ncbi:putative porin [bacterium]|nr:putative porin [candidate division CSSED10-310 bacterium]
MKKAKGQVKTRFLAAALILAAVSGLSAVKAAWTDAIKIKGDLRYRHEMIDKEGSDEARNRHRIRARLQLDAQVNDRIDFCLRLATGSSDPVSTNQSLDDSFSSKGIFLDLAYFDWHPTDAFHFMGGKMKNPFVIPGGAELLWDGDMTPEGLAFKFGSGGDFKFFGNLGGFWVNERSSDDDSYLLGVQLGADAKFGDAKLKFGGGYFTFTEAKGYEPFVDPEDGFGNTLDDEGNYMYDYDLVEGFIDFSTKFGKLPFSAFVDFVTNTDPDEDNTGWVAGFGLGKVKDPGSWAFKYHYKHLEKDAVLGALTNSDFGGGGTDAKGHVASLGVGIVKNTSIGVTYFLNELHPDDSALDYDRLQLDLAFKF